MKKYIVIRYAIHEQKIASHEAFDNENEAYEFLKKDVQNTYEDEKNITSKEDKDSINFTININGTAHLSSYDGAYEWTWEIIETYEAPQTCSWIKYDYRTICPKNHDADNPYWRIPENKDKLKYCPYCSKEIVIENQK